MSQLKWPKYWSFSFSINPFNEYSGLISFRIDWFDLLAVQGTLKSLLQEQRYGCRERGGEGEMYVESNVETYINICKTDSQWEFAVCLRELKQGLCINLEGWNGEGDWKEVQEGGDICTLMADSC